MATITQEYVNIGLPTKLLVNIEDHGDFIFVESVNFPPAEFNMTFNKFRDVKYEGFRAVRLDLPKYGWSFPKIARNLFRLKHILGKDKVYHRWDSPVPERAPNRADKLLPHQLDTFRHITHRRYAYVHGDPGTGKTLAAIEAMEYFLAQHQQSATGDVSGNISQSATATPFNCWFVGPEAACRAINLEFIKWEAHDLRKHVTILTYEEMGKAVLTWQSGKKAPHAVVFDEMQKLKTEDAKRTKYAMALADAIRLDHGAAGAVVGLSGTPAPKDPVDWWSQMEIIWPGFLAEGDPDKLRRTLSATVYEKSPITGVQYPKFLGWLDDPAKCKFCAQAAPEHKVAITDTAILVEKGQKTERVIVRKGQRICPVGGVFTPCKNELANLYNRMKGILIVKLKKDCTGLPAKTYDVIRCKPTVQQLQGMNMLRATARSAAVLLGRCRELSDGFQYTMQESETAAKVCPVCHGAKQTMLKVRIVDPNWLAEHGEDMSDHAPYDRVTYTDEMSECTRCDGQGSVTTIDRAVVACGSPKDAVLASLMDEYEDCGRMVAWGAFTASVDRINDMYKAAGWVTLKIDGRGWEMSDGSDTNIGLIAMDASHPRREELRRKYPKLAVVGNPQAGGVALTFTGSPISVFYSNPFSGEARMQAEDRIHRVGMGSTARIVDIVCLPTDLVVLKNLQQKKDLQAITLGDINESLTAERD